MSSLGINVILLVLSCCGSNIIVIKRRYLLYFNLTYEHKSIFVDIISGAKYTGQHEFSAERYK